MLVSPECGGSGSRNIYTAKERWGVLEPETWWLEPHSKEMDTDPADSCTAALSLGKKKKKTGTMPEKIP